MSSSTESSASPASVESVEGDTAPKRGFVRRLLADTKGTATTETVIMIPMFAVVWGCIFFVFTFFQRTIEMRSITRRDSWMYAYTACTNEPSYGGEATGLDCGGESDQGSVEPANTDSGLVSAVMNLVPGFTMTMLVGSRHASITRPTILGGGSLQLLDRLWIYKNEQPQSVTSFLADLISSFVDNLLGI